MKINENITFNEHDFIGLTLNEKKILVCTSKLPRTYVNIARHTKIPRTTLIYESSLAKFMREYNPKDDPDFELNEETDSISP